MISLPELRAKALRRYPRVLRAHLAGEVLFPLLIPTDKTLDRGQGHEHIHAQQRELLAHAKNRTGHGYWLTTKLNRKTGQSEIKRVEFETLTDYLSFLNKAAEFAAFESNAALTAATVPALLLLPPLPPLLLDYAAEWPDLLLVCQYFQQHPQPNQYVRNLPLALPTKFIERHQSALRQLLDWLVPEHVRAEETDFFRRFHLLLEEPGIKLRFLDAAQRLHPAVSQCSLWASEFRQLNLASQRVFIIENLTTFLSFPPVSDAVAIWGGGFAVSLLAGADWLTTKQVLYWGDIDVHGFQILARLRAYYPAAQSLLMDTATFAAHHHGGQGGDFQPAELPQLTPTEQQLYHTLLRTNARLEQERLPLSCVAAGIEQAIARL
ncbi:Wadjet anti-phage system protein JetD domain-containing protein [Hymenobacter psoromatis]|uniref:Wadjet anti-phage system protein JetD domain-containing protein n=1 Tax=Hymenobacter psoromatis TaxID=1484116 RepID=UPI001CBC3FA9|nr:DUF3322 and DUF2220 domain-containing protein [Hymenobacter psoromatis]